MNIEHLSDEWIEANESEVKPNGNNHYSAEYKKIILLVMILVTSLYGCADADDGVTYKDITFAQCESYAVELKEYVEEQVSPIIKISETAILTLPEMIKLELITELKRLKQSISLCTSKQLFAGDSEESKYHYNLIERSLFPMLVLMENTKDDRLSGDSAGLSVLARFINKEYEALIKELENTN